MMADLSRLLITAFSRDYGVLARQTGRNVALCAAAGLLFLTAYGAGITALVIWLTKIAGAAIAFLAIALGALVLGLIVVALAAARNRRDREIQLLREQLMREQAARPASLTGALLGAAPLLARGNPLVSVLVAGLTAFAAGFAATPKRKKGE